MNIKNLQELLEIQNPIGFAGDCVDCGVPVSVTATTTNKDINISGGAVFHLSHHYDHSAGMYEFKCDSCFDKDPIFHPRTEVYSRNLKR